METQTRDLIDWLVDQDYRQWQSVMEYLNKRIARHEDEIVGHVGGAFEMNRQQLIESVGRTAREVVATYDHAAEARELGESVQRAVAQTALVEVGAVGLGALLVKVLVLDRGGRHRRARCGRDCGARPLHHPQQATTRQARPAGQDQRPAGAAGDSADRPVRERTRHAR